MARQIIEPEIGEPGDGGGNPTPSNPDAPPGSIDNPTTTSPNTKLAKVVSGTSTLFTADEIKAAGGPWTKFKLRVTSINNQGRSEVVEYVYSDPANPPSAPTMFSVADGAGSSSVTWRNPTDSSFGYTRLFRSATPNFADAIQRGPDRTGALGEIQNVSDEAAPGTYYYFIQAFTTTGTPSAVVGPDSATIS